jgi:hypothetical protein
VSEHNDELHPRESAFKGPLNTAVYVCRHVLKEGRPILFATHDHNGDWQFLCGEEHETEDIVLGCLGCILAKDPSLSVLAKMRPCEEANREEGTPWKITDPNETVINENVSKYGWHAALIQASENEPSFAYSIGFFKTYQQPEVIVFGLPHDLMHGMLCDYEKMLKSGSPPVPGERISSMLEGYDCIFKLIDKSHYRSYLGYGLWFNQGDQFPVLQCFWPDKQGFFPWEALCQTGIKKAQPLLFLPKPNHS